MCDLTNSIAVNRSSFNLWKSTMSSNHLPSSSDLKDLNIAVNFALDVLEPYEVSEFLKDHRNGIDLQVWINEVIARRYLADDIALKA